MAAVATITEISRPPLDAVLAADLAFHLGDRDGYELAAMEERTSAVPAPDEAFVGFRIDRRQIFAGEFYKKHCRIGDTGIVVSDGVEIGKKQRRTLMAINREFDRLGRSIPYAYELRDGRQYDYAAIFQTQKPIPVFQYYRRKGCAAIIHPLLGFHTYPSKHIPKVDDAKPFLEKEPKAVWRGQLSGRVAWAGGYTGFSKLAADGTLSDAEKCAILFDQMPRAAICRRHADNPLIDAGLAMSGPALQRLAAVSAVAPLCRERLSIEAQLFHRYLLALDGNDYPSSLYWMLSTNSLVLRQESPWEAFGDCYFQPWVHYVPFARDGGDLVEKIEWCEAHLSRCAGMVANAHRAWSVLFDPNYQAERSRTAHAAYRSWFDQSCFAMG